MRMRTPLFAGALLFVSSTPALACNFYFASTFMRIHARPSFGAGVSASFSDPATFAISGDVAMRLGNNMVVQPGIGVCTGGDNTDPFFGAGIAYRLTPSGTMTINLQSGIAYQTFDGGSGLTVPIGAAASFAGSETMGFYAGASLWWQQFEADGGGSVSNTDPVLFGGLQSASGSIGWSLGAQLFMGDETEFGIAAGIHMNPGANAIRRIGSVFRK